MIRTPAGLAIWGVACLAACAAEDAVPEGAPEAETAEIELTEPIPSFDQPDTLDVATWNTAWLGHTMFGPSSEAGQLAGVRAVMTGLDVDLWAMQEVVSHASFDALLAALPDHDGLLASDAAVADGTPF